MKAKGIRIAIIAIAGVGLFAFQGMKQESAQSANAQALAIEQPNRGDSMCFSRFVHNTLFYDHSCSTCNLINAQGYGPMGHCTPTTTPVEGELQPKP